MMGLLIFIGALLLLVLLYAVGNEFQRIAEMKGHTDKKYLWWTFLFPLAGMAMVIALPDRGSAPKKEAAAVEEKPAEEELPEL